MHNGENTEAVTMESVLQRENLKVAWRGVETNRGAAGVDGMGIKETQEHLRKHWDGIAEKLKAGTYQPAAVRAVEIPKAQGGVRVLGIPNVQDRLIQQAVHQKLSPMWEASFSEHSYGFRPGRSAHDAIRAAQSYVKAEVRRLWDARQSVTSEQLREQWRQYIQGWWNYFKLADRPAMRSLRSFAPS